MCGSLVLRPDPGRVDRYQRQQFRTVANGDSIRDRDALRRYLDSMEQADAEQQATINPSAVQAAIEKLHKHPEPEVGFMRISGGISPAYNVQTAVDAEHALIVTHASRSMQPATAACCRWLRPRRRRSGDRRR